MKILETKFTNSRKSCQSTTGGGAAEAGAGTRSSNGGRGEQSMSRARAVES